MARKTIAPKAVRTAQSLRPVRLELRFRMKDDGDSVPCDMTVTAQELDQDDQILASGSERFIVDPESREVVEMPGNVKAAITALTNFCVGKYAEMKGHELE